MVLDGKTSQEFPVNEITVNFQFQFLALFLMIVISIISAIRHQICGSNLNWPLNLNLIYKTLWTGVKSDFSAGKTQLVSFYWSNNTYSIDLKMDVFFLEEISSFKMLGLTFSSKLDWDNSLSLLLKLPPRNLEP